METSTMKKSIFLAFLLVVVCFISTRNKGKGADDLDILSRAQMDSTNAWMPRTFSVFRRVSPEKTDIYSIRHHHRQLQGSWFSFRRSFCIPDGNGFRTSSVIFFRARRYRRQYGADNEGVCTEEKCDKLCLHVPCMAPYSFFPDSETCLCLDDSIPIDCGKNAACLEEADECRCNEGFHGDPLIACFEIINTEEPTKSSDSTDPVIPFVPNKTEEPTKSSDSTDPVIPFVPNKTDEPTSSLGSTPFPSSLKTFDLSQSKTSLPTTNHFPTPPPSSLTSYDSNQRKTSPPKSTSFTTEITKQCSTHCSLEEKCCEGACIDMNQCCPSTDGKPCANGGCANDIGNFGCCPEEVKCGPVGAEVCCSDGLKCCSNICRTPECCGSTDPCCGISDSCCGSLDPCCGTNPECLPPGAVYGEPHLTTFDGLRYDCQAEGEFVLIKSLNSDFEIQAAFKRAASLSASIAKGLAIRSTKDSHVIQVLASEESDLGLQLWVDGIQKHHVEGGFKSDTFEVGKSGLTDDYFIYCGDASIKVKVHNSPHGQFLDFNINVARHFRNERLVGLLGSPDDDPSNDWMDTSGNPIQIPSTRNDLISAAATSYCAQNWCLRDQAKSLFVHNNATEFASISNGCDMQYGERPLIYDQSLLDYCGEDLDCLLDGFLFGINTARSSVAAQTRYLESATRFHVSPSHLVEGIDMKINVTLDLREKELSFDTANVEAFGLYFIDETTGERQPDRIGTLKRLAAQHKGAKSVASDQIFIGENIDISGLINFKPGSSAGLQACPADTNTSSTNCAQTITGRNAFRALNKFGEGKCFETTEELQGAIDVYLFDNSSSTSVARKYGWPIGIWCVKYIRDFDYLFQNAVHFSESLNLWDVSQATSMAYMFQGASSFNSDIGSWNVGSVKRMTGMFYQARKFNSDISEWNVKSVDSMESMFYQAEKFNIDLSRWTLPSIQINLRDMFSYTTDFRQNLCSWGDFLASNTDTTGMFSEAKGCPIKSDPDLSLDAPGPFCFSCKSSIQNNIENNIKTNAELRAAVNDYLSGGDSASVKYGPIGEWDVSLVTDFSSVFQDKTTFNENINTWDVSRATTMHHMFSGALAFNKDLSSWNVSSVTSMKNMFSASLFVRGEFHQDLKTWDVSSVTDMSQMFYYNDGLFDGLSEWTVSNVVDMGEMFHGAGNFNIDISKWDVSRVTNMYSMFNQASLFSHDLSSWDVSKVTDTSYLFCQAFHFNSDISRWRVSKVKDMRYMFFKAEAFSQNISSWDVSLVTDMDLMFSEASHFSYDLSSWDVSNVQKMRRMFALASSFDQDLCAWGQKLAPGTLFTNFFGSIFQATSCPTTSTPDLNLPVPGPFCHHCYP